MGNVVSAVDKFHPSAGRQERFLRAAHALLEQADQAYRVGDLGLALEYAYQAALRAAGARLTCAPQLTRRRRLPSSAWDKLELLDAASREWARSFRAFSRLRSHVGSGVISVPPRAEVDKLMALARHYLTVIELGDGVGEAA
ncbi:SAV_6107 family HEPN domain-containing protein [Corynebacterium uterequi]|uniref:SAV-6107-like HEPN domain-containing protein n=1 Tax=Corynebacterium uterequi TaxID=1072256 RepID=A0A0G3HDS9_9CORY|nr:SAV_6107 family HEPN domain-containing protein [Corynebacterium uterequi]AKK11469.1 hypothetical protein CUTER_07400 [Corynebacterium uterequi]